MVSSTARLEGSCRGEPPSCKHNSAKRIARTRKLHIRISSALALLCGAEWPQRVRLVHGGAPQML